MLKIQSILAPIEFEDCFAEVARGSVQMALQFQARLYFLHVDDPLAGAPSMVAGSRHTSAHTVEELTRRVAGIVPPELLSTVQSTYHIRKGETVDQIVRFARKQAIDLIVIGNLRRSLLAGLFFSSIQEEVIHKAPCHVLTLHLDN